MKRATDPDSEMGRIGDELDALGEGPIAPEEAAFLRAVSDSSETLHGAGVDVTGTPLEDIATVATLVELSSSYEASDLSQLDRRRVWNKVAATTATTHTDVTLAPAEAASAAGSHTWRSVVAALAMAAGIALIPGLGIIRFGAPSAARATEQANELEELGVQARSALSALDSSSESERASDLAQAYAARLQEAR